MKKGIIVTAMMTSMLIYLLPSCYKNKEDVLSLPKVSFRSDVVPIIVSGGCGCHNNGTTRAVQFSHADTIFYDGILSRVSLLDSWVNGTAGHPGEGEIDFKPSEKAIIKTWIDNGAKDDGGGCDVTGTITYSEKIAPLYVTTCKGSTCHGGIAVTLDYDKLVEKKSVISSIMSSGGVTGHPGGVLSLGTCTLNIFKEWIAQGQPK